MWGSRYFTARYWTARFFSATGSDIVPIECVIDQTSLLSGDPTDSTSLLLATVDNTSLLTDIIDNTSLISDSPTDSTSLLKGTVDSTSTLCRV